MLAFAAAVSFGTASTALAANVTGPIIPPVVTFENAVNGTMSGATLHNGVLTMTADHSLTPADAMSLDTGAGFRAFNAAISFTSGQLLETSTANNLLFGKGGTLSVVENNTAHTVFLTGKVDSMRLITNPLSPQGYSFSGLITVTGGSQSVGRNKFGTEALLFGLIFNVNRNPNNPSFDWTAKTKGNIGNLVPEPGSLALLTMGLCSLATVARRKLAKGAAR
jgi:hypothetical protein